MSNRSSTPPQRSTLGRGSSHQVPWVGFALVAINLITFSWVTHTSRQVEAEAEDKLRAAISYLVEHPYLEPGPVLAARVDASLLDQRMQLLELARSSRSAPPIPMRVQEGQKADLDELVAQALAGVSALPSQRFGVNAADLSPPTLLLHVFLHENGLHLTCGLALLLILGFQLESRWGSAVFAGFFAVASVLSGATFALGNAGFTVPLIGLSGVVAALLAAFAISARSIWYHPVYLFSLILGAMFLLLPPRFGMEWSLAAGLEQTVILVGHRGASYWSVAGGFFFGLVGPLLISLLTGSKGEASALRRSKSALATHSKLEKVLDARTAGRLNEAYGLLTQLLREHPDDHDALLVKWDVALDHGRPAEAADAMLRALRDEVKRNDSAAAVEHWLELFGRGLHADAEPALLIRLALMLQKHEQSHAAVAALKLALAKSGDADAAVVATRVARASRDLDTETAREAAWRALGSVELGLEERQGLETLLSEIGSGIEGTASAEARAGLEIDLGPDDCFAVESDLAGPAPSTAPPEAWVDATLAADAPASAHPDAGDIVLSDLVHAADPARQLEQPVASRPEAISIEENLRGIRVLAARPLALKSDGLRIEAEKGGKKRLPLERIEAISVAAVGGLSRKPVILIDVVMNWSSGGKEPLKVVRLRGDRFDARAFADAGNSPLEALRRLVEALLTKSGATPLPDLQSARGLPFASFEDLAAYQRSVLSVSEDASG